MFLRTTPTSAAVRVPLLAALGLLLVGAGQARADEQPSVTSGWLEVDFGAGQLRRSMPGFSDSAPRFYLSVAGGVAIGHRVMLGVEAGGWEIRTTDPADPSRGATVDPLFFTMRVYPLKTSPFSVRLGMGFLLPLGHAQYTSANPTGIGWEVGVAYDVRIRGHHHITPFLQYHGGQVSATDVRVHAVTAGAGYTWK